MDPYLSVALLCGPSYLSWMLKGCHPHALVQIPCHVCLFFFWHDSLLILSEYLLSNCQDYDLAHIAQFGHSTLSIYIMSPFSLQRAQISDGLVLPFSDVQWCSFVPTSACPFPCCPNNQILKVLFPQSETSCVLVSLRELEISYGLDKLVLECKCMFIIGCHNNFRSEIIISSKPFSRMTQNNRLPQKIMLICDYHSAFLSYVKNESQ